MVLKVQGDVERCLAINRCFAVNFVHAPYHRGWAQIGHIVWVGYTVSIEVMLSFPLIGTTRRLELISDREINITSPNLRKYCRYLDLEISKNNLTDIEIFSLLH